MAVEMIQESVLIEAIMSTRTQIDFLWQVFITVHIAVFAMLFIYGEVVDDLKLLIRIFAVAGMVIFDWINGKALVGAYPRWIGCRPGSTKRVRSTPSA